MNLFLLYGSSTRKTIAGIIVTYASAPATLSVNPLAEAAGAGAAAAPVALAPAADRPQAAQKVAPSGKVAPHPLQKAITASPSRTAKVAVHRLFGRKVPELRRQGKRFVPFQAVFHTQLSPLGVRFRPRT